MAHKQETLTFYIVLSDPALVIQYQTQYPHGVIRGPLPAATEFGAPFKDYVDAKTAAPYTWTPWRATGFPIDRAVFTRHSGGWWIFGGTTTTYTWVGQFKLASPASQDTLNGAAVVAGNISQRRWAIGFEDSQGAESGSAQAGARHNIRDASRHVGQMGLGLRGSSQAEYQVSTTSLRGGAAPTGTWERYYVRPRRVDPLVSVPIYRSRDTGESGGGLEFYYTPAGDLALTNDNGSSGAILALGTLPLDALEWSRIDIIQQFNTGSAERIGADGTVGLAGTMGAPGIGIGVTDGVSTIFITAGFGLNATPAPRVITSHSDNQVLWAEGITAYDTDQALNTHQGSHSYQLDGLAGGAMEVWKNGALIVSAAVPTANRGLGRSGGTHATSELGNGRSTANTAEIDIDDWMCADIPADRLGRDWLNGSKMTLVRPVGLGTAHANWVGDYNIAAQNALYTSATRATLTSSTGSAVMALKTDAEIAVNADSGGLGAVALTVWMESTRGVGSGTLGYTLAGAAAVMAAVVQTVAAGVNAILYSPSAAAPFLLTPLELRHVKGAAADAATVSQLMATVENIGMFGPEDVRESELNGADMPAFPPDPGQHNAPYPNSQWVRAAQAPISPVAIYGGLYAGNGIGNRPTFPAPVHWVFARPLTGGAGGWRWWSTMQATHRAGRQSAESLLMVRSTENTAFTPAGTGDDTQQQSYWLELAGADADNNQIGVTYQYIAVTDPGQRFMLNGQVSHHTNVASITNALINAGFTPQAAFLIAEDQGSSAAVRLGFKSEGHAAASYTKVSGATVIDSITFGLGSIVTQTALHEAGSNISLAFNLWRRADGNADPGQANVAAYGSYIGDGAASRSIAYDPASTQRPLFAEVVPANAEAIFRDPSHTGTTSTTHSGAANASTGITAGAINGMTVGSALNSNGIVYHYFVLLGSATAGNNGWSINGTFVPVEAASPLDGVFDEAVPSAEEVAAGVIAPDDITTDIAAACVAFSTQLCNLALSHLGISKQLVNLGTDVSAEASQCRLHYGGAVAQALRVYPWSFATRYASLALVAGTSAVPVNNDWQYAYRAPVNMKMARRIAVVGSGRKFDAAPITFRKGTDATGDLIYSNMQNDQRVDVDGSIIASGVGVPLQLEYTIRLDCPALVGDDLFRDMVSYSLAVKIGTSLSRDEAQVKFCAGMFDYCLREARATDANEQQTEKPGEASWIDARQ